VDQRSRFLPLAPLVISGALAAVALAPTVAPPKPVVTPVVPRVQVTPAPVVQHATPLGLTVTPGWLQDDESTVAGVVQFFTSTDLAAGDQAVANFTTADDSLGPIVSITVNNGSDPPFNMTRDVALDAASEAIISEWWSIPASPHAALTGSSVTVTFTNAVSGVEAIALGPTVTGWASTPGVAHTATAHGTGSSATVGASSGGTDGLAFAAVTVKAAFQSPTPTVGTDLGGKGGSAINQDASYQSTLGTASYTETFTGFTGPYAATFVTYQEPAPVATVAPPAPAVVPLEADRHHVRPALVPAAGAHGFLASGVGVPGTTPPPPVSLDRVDQRVRYRPLDPVILNGARTFVTAAAVTAPPPPHVVPVESVYEDRVSANWQHGFVSTSAVVSTSTPMRSLMGVGT
jgi:hypothetical protein